MTDELIKVCSKCGRELPLSEFNKNNKNKDGYQYMCRSCMNEYNRSYRKAHLEKYRKYQNNYMKCVKTPTCPKVGTHGAEFEIFICEVCGKEFRKLKSDVERMYSRDGCTPKYCSRECSNTSRSGKHDTKNTREIYRILEKWKNMQD